MIRIVITDTDTNVTFLDHECIAIVGGICTADNSAIELVHTRNSNAVSLAFATDAATNSIQKVFEHDPNIGNAIMHAFCTEDEKGGEEDE